MKVLAPSILDSKLGGADDGLGIVEVNRPPDPEDGFGSTRDQSTRPTEEELH